MRSKGEQILMSRVTIFNQAFRSLLNEIKNHIILDIQNLFTFSFVYCQLIYLLLRKLLSSAGHGKNSTLMGRYFFHINSLNNDMKLRFVNVLLQDSVP